MDVETLVSVFGKPKTELLAKMAGADKRGLEMFFNHNVVVARFSKDGKVVAAPFCSNTTFIRIYNSHVDTQFQKKGNDLPKISKAGLITRNPKVVKSWNLLSNRYCDIPIDRSFLLLGFEPIDMENVQGVNTTIAKILPLMRSGATEVRP